MIVIFIIFIFILISIVLVFFVKEKAAQSKKEAVPGTGGKSEEEISLIIQSGLKKIGKVYKLSENIDNKDLVSELQDICMVCRKIYDNLEKHPDDIKRARTFLNYYTDTLVTIVEKYLELSEHRNINSTIQVSLDNFEKMIHTLKESFTKIMASLLEDDIFDFDLELDHLKRVLKSDGI